MIHCCRLRHRRYSNVMYYPYTSSPLTRNLPCLRATPCPHPQFLLQGLLFGGVLGPLSKAFWGPLGASWALREASWGHLGLSAGLSWGHLAALLDHIGALLDCLEAL